MGHLLISAYALALGLHERADRFYVLEDRSPRRPSPPQIVPHGRLLLSNRAQRRNEAVFSRGQTIGIDGGRSGAGAFIFAVRTQHGRDDGEVSRREAVGEHDDVVERLQRPGGLAMAEQIQCVGDAEIHIGRVGGGSGGSFLEAHGLVADKGQVTAVILDGVTLR